MEQEFFENNETPTETMVERPTERFPSHVQAYDILRRIGELEDAKQSIALEIDECLGQLSAIAEHIDDDSLLNRMLKAVFPKVAKQPTRRTPAKRRKRAKKKR